MLDFNDLEHLALAVLLEEVPEEGSGEKEAESAKAGVDEGTNEGTNEGTDEAVNGAAKDSAKIPAKRRPTAVADELSRQYEEILVDEYQDSNLVQETLITSISPVSYTHLDVYKRQVEIFITHALDVVCAVTVDYKADPYRAVSYTHLDVYKRQPRAETISSWGMEPGCGPLRSGRLPGASRRR